MPNRKDFDDVLGFIETIVDVVATANEKDPRTSRADSSKDAGPELGWLRISSKARLSSWRNRLRAEGRF